MIRQYEKNNAAVAAACSSSMLVLSIEFVYCIELVHLPMRSVKLVHCIDLIRRVYSDALLNPPSRKRIRCEDTIIYSTVICTWHQANNYFASSLYIVSSLAHRCACLFAHVELLVLTRTFRWTCLDWSCMGSLLGFGFQWRCKTHPKNINVNNFVAVVASASRKQKKCSPVNSTASSSELVLA